MTRRRAGALLTALCSALVLLGGCWGIPPVERTGLVSLLGIDVAPGGGYLVTADIVSPLGLPAPSPAGGGGGGGSPVIVRHATGPSLFTALRAVSAVSHLDLGFAHLQGVIISEEAARTELIPALDTLVRSPELSEVAPWLLVARGMSAADVLEETKATTPYPGQVLLDTALWSRQRAPYQPTHIWDFFKQMPLEGDEPVTAGVSADTSQGTGKTAAFRITGDALFRSGRLVGWLDGDAALGWAVATEHVHEQTVEVPGPAGSYTLELHGSRRRIRVTRGSAGPKVEIDLDVVGQIAGARGAPSAFWKLPTLPGSVQQRAEAVLTRDVTDALQTAQGLGADAFSIGEYVRVQDFADWSALGGGWGASGFAHLSVRPVVHVHLADVGVIVCPAGTRC